MISLIMKQNDHFASWEDGTIKAIVISVSIVVNS